MAFFPQLIGGIEIEERRPRYWNEPRHKRLNFVKSRTHRPNDWALVSSTQHHQTETDLWDRRQLEAKQRFLAQEDRELRQRATRIHQDRERYQLLHPPPLHLQEPHHDPRIQQLPPQPPSHHGGHHQIADRRPHHGHDDDDDDNEDDDPIVDICPHDDDDDDDDRSRSPRLIERALPKDKVHKYLKIRREKKKKNPPASIFSSDSEDSEDSFAQGFRYGRRSLSRRPVFERVGRSRSRVFELSDDSFEDLEPRARARSGSRHPRRR